MIQKASTSVVAARFFCIGMFAIILSGCGEKSEALYKVTGTVTYQSQPLTNGFVTFVPATSNPIRCTINSDGTYEAEVPAGAYQIAVDVFEGDSVADTESSGAPDTIKSPPKSSLKAKQMIPAHYKNHQTSQLSYEVRAEDGNTYDISL